MNKIIEELELDMHKTAPTIMSGNNQICIIPINLDEKCLIVVFVSCTTFSVYLERLVGEENHIIFLTSQWISR